MKEELAERLLANVMQWTPEEAKEEIPILQAMALLKYDEYQQFTHGMRFIESLACWLKQFQEKNERKLAYDFVIEKLIFISSLEINHLISNIFPDYIRPILIEEINKSKAPTNFNVVDIIKSEDFLLLCRKSLFLGLSDGARIDIFRRSSISISNEQVWQTYDISKEKATDLKDKLKKDLKSLLSRDANEKESKFKMLFLIDDFSASGISYLRYEKNEYKGKITKFLAENSELRNIIDQDDLKIYVVLYMATEKAKEYLEKKIEEWAVAIKTEIKLSCEILVIQLIPDNVSLSDKDANFIELLKKYFDKQIIDDHYLKGKCEYPYLGFDECALPLVLTHNTPNNSIPLLWFDEEKTYKGLFPRMSRHR